MKDAKQRTFGPDLIQLYPELEIRPDVSETIWRKHSTWEEL